MARVILLNGPAGVGKTTIGRALAALAPNGACIHGDCLKGFVVTRIEGAVESGLGYKNGAAIAATFIEGGYDLVVFEYVFERPIHVERFLDAFRERMPADPIVPVHLFTLWAPLALVVEREQGRADRERLGRRVVDCYHTMEQRLPQLGMRVDNVGAPREIAAKIYGLCEEGAGICRRKS